MEPTHLQITSRFVDALPGDPLTSNSIRQVQACYSRVSPTPVAVPRLLAHAHEVAALLGLSEANMASPALTAVLAGNDLLPGMKPYAACYGGHQFGNWAGQLGDGRAITLGEVVHEGKHWEVQLKGAGPTPYSRHADGRAVLRSSIREFLCSEAMHHLGVPTTRALSLVSTGDAVVRDMLYDGNARPEPGAVVARVAPSFLRFGSYQIHTARAQWLRHRAGSARQPGASASSPATDPGRPDIDRLRQLADYTLQHHFPELGAPSPESYAAWLTEVGQRTAAMVVQWMRVGFVHGVMNTDNMSVLGLTIDYGPYGWMDVYDEDWTPNTTDAGGRRYRFGLQPHIAGWNLARFAESLYPLIGDIAPLEHALDAFAATLAARQHAMMLSKLGLTQHEDDDADLISALPEALQEAETDMTIFYRALAGLSTDAQADHLATVRPALYAPEAPRPRLVAWLQRYAARLAREDTPPDVRARAMNAVNPKYVLRNYLAQEAIEAAEGGDHSAIITLLEIMRRPYDEQPGCDRYAGRRPEWARNKVGCSMLSCSS